VFAGGACQARVGVLSGKDDEKFKTCAENPYSSSGSARLVAPNGWKLYGFKNSKDCKGDKVTLSAGRSCNAGHFSSYGIIPKDLAGKNEMKAKIA
jgi:hypothetical protein